MLRALSHFISHLLLHNPLDLPIGLSLFGLARVESGQLRVFDEVELVDVARCRDDVAHIDLSAFLCLSDLTAHTTKVLEKQFSCLGYDDQGLLVHENVVLLVLLADLTDPAHG